MIAPTLACADWLNLEREIAIMDQAGVDFYHIDLMDGHYVPNLCFNLDLLRAIGQISGTPLDVHLMVTNPLDYVERLSACGAKGACAHLDCLRDPGVFLEALEKRGLKKGLALSPGDRVEQVSPWLERLDYVLVMLVSPGFSGQQPKAELFEKVRQLERLRREKGLSFLIQVDGGVSWENAGALVERGADVLVSGVFASLDRQGELGERTRLFRACSCSLRERCREKEGTR